MPELRRSTRASTVKSTQRSEEQPRAKKARTSTGPKKVAPKEEEKVTKKEDEASKTENGTSIKDDAKEETKKDNGTAKEAPKPGNDSEVAIGDEIPDLKLLDENENEVSLKEVAKKSKYLVIFAYPRASTRGCTKQAAGFQKNYAELESLGTSVYGLSADSPKSQANFVHKQGLKYPLLSDPSRKLISVLGAKKSPTGIKRSHWIFVDGKLAIKKIQISPAESVDSALQDVQKLKESA